MIRRLGRLAAPLLFALAGALPGPAAAETETRFPASEHERTTLTIRAAADLDAMAPLIRDYQLLYPDVTVVYHEYVTADLFGEVQRACAEGRRSGGYAADVVISSSVDHLIKLANDGCARAHRSIETGRQPDWAAWRDEVFGFTTEPAVIAYRPDLVPREDLPRSRVELVDLLRRKPDAYAGRIGSYDITLSGVGYLFAVYDARAAATYGRLVEAFGRASLRVRCCTADVIADLEAGRIAIGYNLLGSYVYGAMRRGARLGIVVPRDYTLVLSRAAMVPVTARAVGDAFAFLDYLLSARGQRVSREEAFFFDRTGPLPPGVDGPPSLAAAGLFRPITVGPVLLAVQDRAKRARFLAEWRQSIGPQGQTGGPAP
ncbi:ABC transporter substrate-binding protein [Methylobacterium platani]|uniref:ABC transporter substrate-binding protein n=2 Tax=Methylobacterium platani TaxID=427683 RepID=A0A179S5X1_9HYPH|nr:ABC transporter substrate-binding protein [Methylobacterium platani]KMO15927.1 ABC transporter substrate-binding protein [Methylobacterium platani JCM 14648]OAS22443.1 ABC transporter substrate-binding protein [Methylobacterium platani]